MKLGEAVEWLERDYDKYETEIFSGDAFGIPSYTRWYRPYSDTGMREMGLGPSHEQPMFNFKAVGAAQAQNDSYYWWGSNVMEFVPLSRESENAPL